MIIPSDREADPWCRGAVVRCVRFASFYVHCPSGEGEVCRQARSLCARLKEANSRALPQFAAQVWWERMTDGRFAALFGREVVLVPVPASCPRPSAAWVGARLAWCLKEMGLARAVWPCLRRRYPVRKSAFAPPGERPTVLEHYASFDVAADRMGAGPAGRLVLVDDVITRGRTLLAAAARLREAFPECEIVAFALMRTVGRGEVPSRNPDPCEGQVRWQRGDARRIP